MKKALFPAIIILMAALYFSCSKKKTYLEFDMPYSTDIAVPTLTAGMVYTLTTQDVLTRVNEELTKNATNSNLVGEAKYTSFSIAVKSPTVGASLSFIRSIKFYINAVNLPEQQVAFRYNENKICPPAGMLGSDCVDQIDTLLPGVKTATLHINDANLKGRFMENSVYFKYKIDPLYSVPAFTITLTHNIHVKAISE